MSLYTKTGDRIVRVEIDNDCYYRRELLQLRATIEGEIPKRLVYISDLKADRPNEIKDVVKSTLKGDKKGL